MSLKPRVACTITPMTGDDGYGQPVFGTVRSGRCSVVRLERSVKTTSVRTDSSASQARAEEVLHDARLLFGLVERDVLKIGDLVEVFGTKLRVMATHLRVDACGRPHHVQVELDRWH